MTGIYKITNLINDKSYIGQSIDIERRFKMHKRTAFNKNSSSYHYPLYRAIRKYGIDKFSFDILEECLMEELDNKEIDYIEHYNTYYSGYNLDKGGSNAAHYHKLSDDSISNIIERLKNTIDSADQIGEDFGVTGRTVRGINSGEYCHRESETYPIRPPLYTLDKDGNIKDDKYFCKVCGVEITVKNGCCLECCHMLQRKADRPEPIELARLIKENGFVGTGKIFNVDGNAIKQWCKVYNIPYLKTELIAWYNKELGIEDTDLKKKKKIDQRKKVKQIDPITNQIVNIFPSENAAARNFGKKKGTHIGEACRGIHKLVYGFKWEYA